MRETTGNPDQTGNLPIKVEFLAKTENDHTVNTSILVVGFRPKQCQTQSSKKDTIHQK